MDKMRYIYFSFLVTSLILSIFCYKKDKALYVFPILLSVAFITEIAVLILWYYKKSFFFLYHIYLPIEYSLLAYYFYLTIDNPLVKKVILYSIPSFIMLSLMFTLEIVSSSKYPNFQTNIECFLLVIWSTITIFTIDVKEDINIISLPVFWVCTAVLIYHCGVFSYTGVFNYLMELKPELFNKLEFYVLKILNYILYTCLSIAFICSHRMKRYS